MSRTHPPLLLSSSHYAALNFDIFDVIIISSSSEMLFTCLFLSLPHHSTGLSYTTVVQLLPSLSASMPPFHAQDHEFSSLHHPQSPALPRSQQPSLFLHSLKLTPLQCRSHIPCLLICYYSWYRELKNPKPTKHSQAPTKPLFTYSGLTVKAQMVTFAKLFSDTIQHEAL